MKILIVEDEIIIAMEIAERLESMGYEVLRIVANGKMAVEVVKTQKPDLILMDIMIQGDMDGVETANQIRTFSDTPVIYLTANADEATLQRAKVSDAFGYLIKPFEERELNTTIEMALYKHKMESKLKENEERFRSLVQNSSIGIFRMDKEAKILLANPALAKILGYNLADELINKYLYDFIVGGKAKLLELYEILSKNRIVNGYRIEVIQKNTTKISVSFNGNVVVKNNQVQFIDGTFEDVSIQDKYQKELIKAKEKAEESDRLKTEFLAGMSHEIRTPVNTIMSYISLLKNELDTKENEQYKDVFKAIELGSLRLTRTIDSILNMAQFQAGTFEVFCTKIDILEEILNHLYEEFRHTAQQRGLELRLSNTAQQTKILGDKYSLSQLFVNLIDNGLKYTKEGYVEIKVFNDENGALTVDVEDSGIGISKEFLPTLFQPFTQEEQGYTRKFDGNGLGLALVKKYCEINNAFIKVTSTKGVGTKFSIKFSNTNSNNSYQVKESIKNEKNL